MLQIEAQIDKVETLKDGGLKIKIITQELIPQDNAELFELNGKAGHMVFKEASIKEEDLVDLPDEVSEFKKDKTPSERLRSVLYVYWEQNGSKGDFNDFYKKQMNKIIDKIKDKLN